MIGTPAATYYDPTVIDRLSDHMIAEYSPAFCVRLNQYMPHAPTPKQRAFLLLQNQEALFGGAAGGGKSDALLMAALQYCDVPGYSAILFRRTYADLERPGSLIPRSHEWLNSTDAHWNGRRWTFPSGAVLDFGYMDNDADKYNYQSSQYVFIGWDELTQFQEPWYRYMFSRKRRLASMGDVPTRVRGATNPGGIGHEWVKQRFLVEGRAAGRVFIPSKLEDNPYLDREEYDASLMELDEVTRLQLRHGDWAVRPPGTFFKRQWFEIIDIDELPANAHWIRMWDLAATKNQTSAYTAGAKLALVDGVLYIADMRRIRGDPGEVESLIRQTAELDGRGVEVWIEQEPGSGGINTIYRYQHTVLVGWAVRPYLPKHDKLTRAGPFSAISRARNVRLVRGKWIGPCLDELESFPEGYKDQTDVCSAGLQVLAQSPVPRLRRL